MGLTSQDIEEVLSDAYVRMVCGRAGMNILKPDKDYGIDGTFRPITIRDQLGKPQNRRLQNNFTVDYQLKATIDWTLEPTCVVYDLEAKTYNDLVFLNSNSSSPCILLVLCLHKDHASWLVQDEDALRLHHCCYWAYLIGAETTNTATKRIRIPRSNQFTPTALSIMFDRLENGVPFA